MSGLRANARTLLGMCNTPGHGKCSESHYDCYFKFIEHFALYFLHKNLKVDLLCFQVLLKQGLSQIGPREVNCPNRAVSKAL
jgi:hypothetical protein